MTYANLDNDSKTLLEGTGFTQISNNVINNIKDGDAFLVWCYLYSKSANWKTIKQNIKNVYGFGDAKLKKIFSYLNRANLIEYVQSKCAKGQFNPVQIRILNGAKFDKTQCWLEDAPHVHKPAPAVKHTNGNDELLNKEVTKERSEHKKEDLNNSADKPAQENLNDGFDKFWDVTPIRKNKLRAQKIWHKKKLYLLEKEICNDILNRLANDRQWQDKQYIPHPSTYLTNELWNDEIDLSRPILSPSKQSANNFNETMKKNNANQKRGYYDERGNFTECYL